MRRRAYAVNARGEHPPQTELRNPPGSALRARRAAIESGNDSNDDYYDPACCGSRPFLSVVLLVPLVQTCCLPV